ncbi:uncharacterized protein LOC143464963 [Clavelina lepadiformis]|uniref:uncharacterized protein LOC143464963 n=1 Tax=Clavelina lepadiformis TaxID=159417 RepID=UPI0040412E4D
MHFAMKEQNNTIKHEGPKKFLYSGPPKKETLPQQWSQEFNTTQNKVNAQQSMGSFNLDSVWSIKKNMTVDSNKKPSSNNYSFSLPTNKRDHVSIGNTFYSRHKTISANPVDPLQSQTTNKLEIVSPEKNNNDTRQKKPWQRGSATTQSNTSSSPQNVFSDEDEFDFNMPSNSKKWNSEAINTPSPRRSNPYPGTDRSTTGISQQKTDLRSSKFVGSSYGNKYNPASFDF